MFCVYVKLIKIISHNNLHLLGYNLACNLIALDARIHEKFINSYLSKAIKKYNPANAIIRRQDVSAVFASVYSASQLGVNVTLDFLITNISEVLD